MAGWLFDEDITSPSVNEFNSLKIHGLTAKDVGVSGREDNDIIQAGKHHKATIITGNYKEWKKMNPVAFKGTYGAWILKTQHPKEQAKTVKYAIDRTGLRTSNLRKNKKVLLNDDNITVIDCTNQQTTVYKKEKNYPAGW